MSTAGPLRILHVSQPVEAGVARVVLGLARHQHAAGHDVTVACPTGGHLGARLAAAGVTVLPWEAVRTPQRGVASEIAALRGILRAVRPDVVHLHSSKAGLVGRLTVRGVLPTLFQPHAWADQAVGGPVRVAARLWDRFADRWTDVSVCGSDAEARHGIALGVRPPVVVRNGVDLTGFTPRDRAAARQRLGLGRDQRVAVCVGRLSQQKGQDHLVDAWASVQARRHDVVLALVGGGPDEARLRAAADGLAVLFDTGCDDPRDWYAAADVVVAPSRWEGAALVPLEAMAMGRAVVGYDVGGLGDVLPTPGAAVAPGDLAGLVRALVARLHEPAAADDEGARNRRTAETAFDDRATYRTITDLAVDLTRGGARTANDERLVEAR